MRAGAGHSHVAPCGTALDVARMLEDEGDGHIKTYRVQWLLEGVVAGEETLTAQGRQT